MGTFVELVPAQSVFPGSYQAPGVPTFSIDSAVWGQQGLWGSCWPAVEEPGLWWGNTAAPQGHGGCPRGCQDTVLSQPSASQWVCSAPFGITWDVS